jgi:hypothetical protein
MNIWQWWSKQNERRVYLMAALYSWLQQTWSSLVAAADSSDEPTQTDDPSYSDPCHLYQDALDEELRQMDLQNQRIADLLDQFWSCRKSHAAGSIERLQNWNTAQQSLDGAKLLLKTAANQVRQVVDEIEIVTQREQQ